MTVNMAHAQGIATQITRIPAVIGERSYQLEVLIASPNQTGKHPVALITHGSAGNGTNPEEIRAETELGSWALDFASRGYLAVAVMRRGYGLSDGEVADDAGTCKSPTPKKYLGQHADDLEAALETIASRPDVDVSTIITVGHSTGGAAALALAARSKIPIASVINISGGLYHFDDGDGAVPFHVFDGCELFRQALIEAVRHYGSRAAMPTLWLYAENDPWFRPDLVKQMVGAWRNEKGTADLIEFPPYIINGHRMFFEEQGRRMLLPKIDDFLRINKLPTWSIDKFRPLRKSLTEKQAAQLDSYLSTLSSEKALVISKKNKNTLYWSDGQLTLYKAKKLALSQCEKSNGHTCDVLLENFDLPIEKFK